MVGIVIKLLDDDVDQDPIDSANQIPEGIRLLKVYKLPYCLFFLSTAMVLDTAVSFSLFSSAYIIGMIPIASQLLPLKLKSYQEALLVILLNLLLIPHWVFIHGFLLILLIQLIDDVVDLAYDLTYGYHNYCLRFGKGEVIILSSILLVAVFLINWMNSLIVLPMAFLINYLYCQY